MKTSVVLEAEYLPEPYRSQIKKLAFQTPANPQRPLAHVYEWLDVVIWTPGISHRDVETMSRIIRILEGEKVVPRPRRGLLARLLGL